jgi:hypothetical protein
VRRRRRRTHAALSVLAGANDRYGLREGMDLSAGSSPRPSSLSFPQEALYADADRRNCWRQSYYRTRMHPAASLGRSAPLNQMRATRPGHGRRGSPPSNRSTTSNPSLVAAPLKAEPLLSSPVLPSAPQPPLCSNQGFFTAGYCAVCRGNRRYRWGTVTVPSGRTPPPPIQI